MRGIRALGALAAVSVTAGCAAASVLTHSTDTDPIDAPAGAYALSPRHSHLLFAVDHLGFSLYRARFDDWEATLEFDPAAVGTSRVTARIAAASVNTGDAEIDTQLKGRDFFDASRYPRITFASRSVTVTGADTGRIEGDLTIRETTRPVTLDVTFNGGAPNPLEPFYVLGFSATGSFSRSAFGLANWLPAVGDEVIVQIEAEFQQPR